MGAVAAIGSVVSGIGGMIGANQAKKSAQGQRNSARREQQRLQRELEALENNRQPIINPYANVKDTSGNISNPYANLGVATQAAEFQAEQAEISLANTLDTLRATGASAGGATALAQAALASKKKISASLEMQEAKNQQLFAKGEQQYQMIKMQEAQRLQNADVMGKTFEFQSRESREAGRLNRKAGQVDNANAAYQQSQAAYQQAKGARFGSIVSGATSIIGGAASMATSGGGQAGYWGNGSDRRLKKNIKLIGRSSSGLNIYAFEYINKAFGEGTWQGVMSDEIPREAVVDHMDGYDRVDYSKLDVEFKKI